MPTTQPTWLSPEFITALTALVVAIGAAVAAVVAAIKGQRSETKTDANTLRLDRQSDRTGRVEDFQKSLALQMPPPAAPVNPNPLLSRGGEL